MSKRIPQTESSLKLDIYEKKKKKNSARDELASLCLIELFVRMGCVELRAPGTGVQTWQCSSCAHTNNNKRGGEESFI